MLPNPFKRRKKRIISSPIPIEAAADAVLPSTASPPPAPVFETYSTLSTYSRYTASPSASSYYGMSTSTSSASPVYTSSSRQASPFCSSYSTGSRHPSPLATGAAPDNAALRYSNPWNDGMAMFSGRFDGEGYFHHSSSDTSNYSNKPPLTTEFGIAPSRNNEIFRPKGHNESLMRRVAVPRGLVQAMSGPTLRDDEEVGATRYLVMEEHMENMRRVLLGACSGTPVNGSAVLNPTVMQSPLSELQSGIRTSLAPLVADRKDSLLTKIEEKAEPEEEDTSTCPPSSRDQPSQCPSSIEATPQGEDQDLRTALELSLASPSSFKDANNHNTTAQSPPHTPHLATPDLSSSCGSPASADTLPTPTFGSEKQFVRKPVPDSSREKIPPSPIEWFDDEDGWGSETLMLLHKISLTEYLNLQ